MRLLTTLVSSALLLVFANAQNETLVVTTSPAVPDATSAAVVSGTQGLTPAQSSQAACLSACPATDPNCRAKCITDANPTADFGQQNSTINCVTSCDHGDGTAAENLLYENCLKACVAAATITPISTAAPTTAAGSAATGGSGSGGDSPANDKTTKTTGTDSATGATGTLTASPSASSKAAAENMRVEISLVGFLGVFAAIFAL